MFRNTLMRMSKLARTYINCIIRYLPLDNVNGPRDWMTHDLRCDLSIQPQKATYNRQLKIYLKCRETAKCETCPSPRLSAITLVDHDGPFFCVYFINWTTRCQIPRLLQRGGPRMEAIGFHVLNFNPLRVHNPCFRCVECGLATHDGTSTLKELQDITGWMYREAEMIMWLF